MSLMDKSCVVLVGLFASILHEFGHIIIMLYEKREIGQINVGMFNVDIIDGNRSELNYKSDIKVLLGGPLINYFTYLIFIILYCIIKIDIIKFIAYENLIIGIINILPIANLDGGQIIFAILSKFLRFDLSVRITQIISFLTLIPLSILGFIILFDSKYNFSLLFLSMYLMCILLWKKDSFYI